MSIQMKLQEIQSTITDCEIQSFVRNENNITLFNIESTTRCNNLCTYCHVYEEKFNRKIWIDIDDWLFVEYMKFISEFSKKTKTTVQWRFSWWDPIVLWDKLFDLANLWYKITDIPPYILTAWKGITEEWIIKCRNSCIKNAFISVENPFDPDIWANPPENVIESINKYDNKDFQLLLWVCVIKNSQFKNILKICDYFYEKTWQIPSIHELNYWQFEKPTQEQLDQLEQQLNLVLERYGRKLLIVIFPSVFPEMSFGWDMVFLSDLPITDKYNFTNLTYKEKYNFMMRRYLWFSYPKFSCKIDCDLKEFCWNIKRFWRFNIDWTYNEDRFQTYCKMKKMLAKLYLRHFDKNTDI